MLTAGLPAGLPVAEPGVVRSRAQRLAAVDLALFRRTAGWHVPVLDRALPRLTRAADHSVLWMAVATVLAATQRRRPRRAALRGLGSLAVASATANIPGKLSTRRTRPPVDVVPLVRRARRMPTSTSFPSGHSASAAAFATGVALESHALAGPVLALAAGVAYSRVYTGAHYPGDVLAGVALGAAVGVASTRVWPLALESPAAARPAAGRAAPQADPHGEGLVVVVNTAAGGDAASCLRKIAERLPAAEVVEVGPDEDVAAAMRAAAARARVLGVAGGDGTVNTAARAALEAELPLLVLPAGTLDHFAHELGVDTVDAGIDALQAGEAVCVDVGDIGGRPFLNTASFGAYTELVDIRERYERRLGKWPALALALASVLRHAEPVEVTVDGRRRSVWMAFIGNCRYHPSGFAPAVRGRLDDGLLDVRMVAADRGWSRTRLGLAVLTGRLGRCRVYAEWQTRKLEIDIPESTPRLARDGETFDGAPRFTVSKCDRRLTVFRPAT